MHVFLQSDNRGQSFRNGSNAESNGDLKIVDASSEEATELRIGELVEVHHPHNHTNPHDNLSKQLTKLIDFLS